MPVIRIVDPDPSRDPETLEAKERPMKWWYQKPEGTRLTSAGWHRIRKMQYRPGSPAQNGRYSRRIVRGLGMAQTGVRLAAAPAARMRHPVITRKPKLEQQNAAKYVALYQQGKLAAQAQAAENIGLYPYAAAADLAFKATYPAYQKYPIGTRRQGWPRAAQDAFNAIWNYTWQAIVG